MARQPIEERHAEAAGAARGDLADDLAQAQAAEADFVDDLFLEKLYTRNHFGQLPSRIEQIATQEEKLFLQEGCRESYNKRGEAMLNLLNKFDNSLSKIAEDNVKENAKNLAKLVKDKFVYFAVRDCLQDRELIDVEGYIMHFTLLAFRDQNDSFNFNDYATRFRRGEIQKGEEIIEQYANELAEIQQSLGNNNQNVR